MTKILDILEEFLKEIEKNNPYKLITKGGTTLALYHLNHHRESEDLDFDAISDSKRYKEIETYFLKILECLKQKGIIKNYFKGKSGLAATNLYHMKIQLETYKIFYTKIDVNFVKNVKNLNKEGELFFYPLEKMFIDKMISFINRKEFKDLYDLYHLIPKINKNLLNEYPNINELLKNLINAIQNEEIIHLYKNAFKNVDLQFKNLKEPNVNQFISNLIRNLNKLRSK